MTASSADDRQAFAANWSDAADFSSSSLPADSFGRLAVSQQFHALALSLKGLHPLSICGALRRRHRVLLGPAELEEDLNAAIEAACNWLKRPLPARLAILCFEKLPERFRGKDTSPLWTAMGIAPDGARSILGFWPERAGAGFWLEMQRDLKRRGLRHAGLVVAERGGPLLPALSAGFPDARLVLNPLQALAQSFSRLPPSASARLQRALESAALAQMPPTARALPGMAERQSQTGETDAAVLAGVQAFLDLPETLRGFLLKAQVITVIREKLQRNAVIIPMEGDGETRALLLAHSLRGMDKGWKVAPGRWRVLHESLAGLGMRRLGHQRLDAKTVGHADQLHQ
jgi:hypothetical protein